MAFLDFLTEGKAPEAVPVSSTSQTVLPDWYTNYAMQLLSNQQALMNRPYTTYEGPRVAPFTALQQQAFGQVPSAANAYQPSLTAATQATQNALAAPSGLATAQPYFNQVAGMSGLGAAQPYITKAADMSALSAAQPYFGQATGMSGLGAAEPSFAQAEGMSGMAAAQPYLAQAGQTTANVGEYMNPYTEQVVNRIGELGARTLREQLMPAISDKAISAGQFGGTRQAEMIGRGLRDVSEGVTAQQAQALQQGYGAAQAAKAADLARSAGLAGTAGNLTQAQQQLLASLGTQRGQLTQQQQQLLSSIGAQTGNLTSGQQQLLANLGQQVGGLTSGQQQILAGLGTQAGGLAQQGVSQQGALASQLASLGGLAQQYGLTGVGALQQAGAQQQQLGQQNLDVAYADFLRQQGYQQEQIGKALEALKGVAPAVPQGQQMAGTQVPSAYQPSTLSTLGQLGLTAAALFG